MNKQELLKTLEEWKEFRKNKNHELQYYQLAEVIHLVKQLDNPEKVKVPVFAAEYIEKCKNSPYPFLADAMTGVWNKMGCFAVADWLQIFNDLDGIDDDQAKRNQYIFARAWIDGYEVEEEPKYRVEIPLIKWNSDSAELEADYAYLIYDITTDETQLSASSKGYKQWRAELTEIEIKSIDERYWQFAVPVEKV